MTSPKQVLHAIVFGLILAFYPLVSQAGEAVQFSWAVLTDTEAGLRALDFSSVPKLKSGDTLQIYIEQQPGAYIYIYLIDSTNGLTCIFPGNTVQNAEIAGGQTFRIPPDSGRFELTPPEGQERLYLLASATRLEKLENLTAAFERKPDNADLKADVIKELKLLRRQHSTLAQKTETSVPVAGTIRSRGVDGSFDATRVDADGFYSRILRIDHD